MCGIFGINYRNEKLIGPTLINAGLSLSYRGYDSVGIGVINEKGEIDLRKDAGKVNEVAEKYKFHDVNGKRGILQLRWATFGAPSKENSQNARYKVGHPFPMLSIYRDIQDRKRLPLSPHPRQTISRRQ